MTRRARTRAAWPALFLALVTVLALSWFAPATAQNCDRPGSLSEMTECATLRLRAAEREMGEVYGRLLDSEDREFAATARKAQEAWMAWREAEAALAARTVNDKALEPYTRRTLEAQLTEDRVKDLRSYGGN